MSELEIRRLTRADLDATRRVRLEALEQEPASFGESVDEFARLSLEALAHRLGEDGAPRETDDNFIYAAFDGSALIAMAGFFRESRVKRRHKGTVWGVYVAPAYRGRGVGRAVMTALLDHARTLPGLRYVYLSVGADSPARRLYLSVGFQPFGIEPEALGVNGRYFDEEHMLLRLV
jgi:ribosomal protein S18 acetylase RimI-like enzyme